MSRGATLAEALDDDVEVLPPAYRCLIQVGLRSGRLEAGLDGSERIAEAAERSRYGVRAAFFYPLVVCLLAYLGLIGFCLWFEPVLENVYAGLRLPPGRGLTVLRELRSAMPLWIALPPAALLAWWAWGTLRRPQSGAKSFGRGGLAKRPAGASGALLQRRWANYADALATLLDAETPLGEGMRLAACASDDSTVAAASHELALAIESGEPLPDDRRAAQGCPPFLRWAIADADAAIGRAAALRMAAAVYRDAAERIDARRRNVTPALACIVVGGAVTLCYALAVFSPVIDLLYAMSLPPAVQ
jgi:type II secretory pathway component PulF